MTGTDVMNTAGPRLRAVFGWIDDETEIRTALFPGGNAPAALSTPARVVAAVEREAPDADLLLVYLIGRLDTRAGRLVFGLTSREHAERLPPEIDLDNVVRAAALARALVLIIDGMARSPNYRSESLRTWVNGIAGATTCVLIGEAKGTSGGNAFTHDLGELLRTPRWGLLRRAPLTIAELDRRLNRKPPAAPYQLVSHLGRECRDRSLTPGRPARPPGARRRIPPAVWGAAVIVVVAAIVGAIYIFVSGPGSDEAAACRPPLELRVLSAPEGFPAIQAAAVEFADGQRDSNRCRLVHLTVYQAGIDATLRGFARADGWARSTATPSGRQPGTACPGVTVPGGSGAGDTADPSRDIGPRPDVWFPDSTVDVDRARCVAPAAAVGFGVPASIARSPLVLAVPKDVDTRFLPSTPAQDWRELRTDIGDAKLGLVRPNPATSTAGLLQTVGLYGALGGVQGAVRDLESSLVAGSLPLSDSTDLLCQLTPGAVPSPAGPALLVSETAMVNYNRRTLEGCRGREPRPALMAHYPTGFPALDHPFADLTWASEPRDQRRVDLVARFRDWLLSKTGQQTLSEFGLRPVDASLGAGTAVEDQASGASPTVAVAPGSPDPEAIRSAIDSYANAHRPGRVAFLMDVSRSMSVGGGLAAARGVVDSALTLMGRTDEAVLTAVPRSTGDSAEPNRLVPPATPDSGARARAGLDQVVVQRNGIALYDAIDQQLAELLVPPGPDRQALVVLTGGEDVDDQGTRLSGQTVAGLLAKYPPGRRVAVQVVAFAPATCAGELGQLAAGLGGQCLSTVDSGTPAALVAGVWQGGGG